MSLLYANQSAFHDITTGTSTGSPNYSAGPGYDYVTGLGTPIANLVVNALTGTSTAHDTLVLSASTTETAGKSFSLTVTAKNSSGATDTGYAGTISFSSSDAQAGLPGNFKFSTSNDGTATFTVTLKTAGSQSITATDTSNSAVTGTLSGISVSPAAASQLTISGLSSSATVGVADSFSVTAYDPYGNVATGYTGTVKFTSTDSAATLPANYPFTKANAGTHSFSVTFGTPGTQSLTVTDTSSGFAATQSGISVAPAAPTGLTATAASNSQINLAWTGSKGATGYIVDESLNGTSGWTQIATTTSASYQATGLTAGTTYYFEAIATVGSIHSSPSNVASATTTGTPPTGDTIWPNSYTPSENAWGSGSYELGVRFTASESGEVTGVRFYKQTWMGGVVHVGHLWSSSGTLLATATFTNETSYGWQQVTFAIPVTIQANTVYVASFSTGGYYFGATTGFFGPNGVTNGPLQAEGTTQGDGVYNNAGSFPDYVDNGVNFWADVAFTPTATKTVGAATGVTRDALGGPLGGSSSMGTPQLGVATRITRDALGGPLGGSSSIGTLPQFGTPQMPNSSTTNGSRGPVVVTLGPVAYRGPVTQAATVASWFKKSSSPFGLL